MPQGYDDLIPFKVKGTNAFINSIGLPTVTTSKYVVLQAQGPSFQTDDGQMLSGPTYLKVLYLDTSACFFQKGAGKGASQLICDKAISNIFVANSHLSAGRPA